MLIFTAILNGSIAFFALFFALSLLALRDPTLTPDRRENIERYPLLLAIFTITILVIRLSL